MSEQTIDPRRELAVRRIRERSAFWTHLFTFVVINAMIVLVWVMTGHGFFWPIFVILAWGMGLVIHGYNAFFAKGYTEAQVQKEMERLPKDLTEV